MTAPHVVVDARMLMMSGIGTYIRELLPRIVTRWESARFTLIGDAAELRAFVPESGGRVRIEHCTTPIYSVAEQLDVRRAIPIDATLFWAPHYNIPLLYRGPLAVTVHDVNHLALPPASAVRRLYARTVFRAVRRRASVVMCDSHFTAAEFRARVGEPGRLDVIPLGVSDKWFQVPLGGDPVGPPYFLFVGNVKPHKNLPRLLEAFARVADRLPHRLVIVGKREGFLTGDSVTESLAATLGDRVVFTGYVPEDQLTPLVAGCDALILPSLYEGFGLPPLEAMAVGNAVGVSRGSSLPEVCGSEADYFDPTSVASIAECLVRLGERPPDTVEVRARRRAWARRFSWKDCAEQTLSTLKFAAGS